MKDKKNQLEKLLENELICFKEILYKTQQVSREEDTPSTESLVNLLKYRNISDFYKLFFPELCDCVHFILFRGILFPFKGVGKQKIMTSINAVL